MSDRPISAVGSTPEAALPQSVDAELHGTPADSVVNMSDNSDHPATRYIDVALLRQKSDYRLAGTSRVAGRSYNTHPS